MHLVAKLVVKMAERKVAKMVEKSVDMMALKKAV